MKKSLAAGLLIVLGVVIERAAESQVEFTGITDAAGIRFRHVSAPEKKYIVESMSGGVALFDYDNPCPREVAFQGA